MAKRYLKLRCDRRVVLVEEVRPGAGWRVTKEGVRWFKEDKTTYTEELVLYTEHNVVCEMRMNLHYGELEPAST